MERITFELDAAHLIEIDQMVAECGFSDRNDLFNNALTLMKWTISHAKQGHDIAALDEDSDKYWELKMPFLGAVRLTT